MAHTSDAEVLSKPAINSYCVSSLGIQDLDGRRPLTNNIIKSPWMGATLGSCPQNSAQQTNMSNSGVVSQERYNGDFNNPAFL